MSHPPVPPAITVNPPDVRYPALSRGFNQRWIAQPEYVRMVTSAQGSSGSRPAGTH